MALHISHLSPWSRSWASPYLCSWSISVILLVYFIQAHKLNLYMYLVEYIQIAPWARSWASPYLCTWSISVILLVYFIQAHKLNLCMYSWNMYTWIEIFYFIFFYLFTSVYIQDMEHIKNKCLNKYVFQNKICTDLNDIKIKIKIRTQTTTELIRAHHK